MGLEYTQGQAHRLSVTVERLKKENKQLKHKIMILEKPWMEQEFFCKHTVRSDKGIACELSRAWCGYVNNQDRCITFEEGEE